MATERSLKHNGLYHSLITIAYENWPDNHGFRPIDITHLRLWLQCKAGHCDMLLHAPGDDESHLDDFIDKVAAGASASGYVWSGKFADGTRWAIIPRSINFDDVEQFEFNSISEKVFQEICNVLGTTVKSLKDEMNRSGRRNVR